MGSQAQDTAPWTLYCWYLVCLQWSRDNNSNLSHPLEVSSHKRSLLLHSSSSYLTPEHNSSFKLNQHHNSLDSLHNHNKQLNSLDNLPNLNLMPNSLDNQPNHNNLPNNSDNLLSHSKQPNSSDSHNKLLLSLQQVPVVQLMLQMSR